jgi:hypothetical protein
MPSSTNVKTRTHQERERFAIIVLGFVLFGGVLTPPSFADNPRAITFPPENAKFVRLVITASTSGSEPCVDELEVYGADEQKNLALYSNGGKAWASSCLAGYAIHQIEHLNDGQYGNGRSWIAASNREEWCQIEFPAATEIRRVVFSRDRTGVFSDRIPASFEVRVSVDGEQWKTVHKAVAKTDRITGSGAIPNPPPPPVPAMPPLDLASQEAQLRYAFLGEEHAWLKTYGRADLSPALVPYNGRVKEYPRHVGDDYLPLPPIPSLPEIDGRLDDACWKEASRGVARVAFPYDFELAPCVSCEVWAGWRDTDLFLAIRTDRLLSGHLAVVSTPDFQSCGVIVCGQDSLTFNTYMNGKIETSTPLDSAFNEALTRFEMRLPLKLLPDCQQQGLRVGLGMGGKHTGNLGRPVNFVFAPIAAAEEAPSEGRAFRVRLSVPQQGTTSTLKLNASDFDKDVKIEPGRPVTLSIPANRGSIGPECNLTITQGEGKPYELHLFRYDPLERTLALMAEMIARLEGKGIDVAREKEELAKWRARQDKLLGSARPHAAAERRAFFEARVAKRDLLLRDPDLAAISKILFVKRNPFKPSHNYSDYFDAPFHPGGGIFVAETPFTDGRFDPAAITLKKLFDSQGGIARNPAANFDLTQVYFGYRPSAEGYYHVMAMNADGGNLKQLTDGPFHDFWPCPLPDGGLAFISTRCTSRVFCWRPQSSVLFRMDTDGQNIQPVSLANITEWAPSVMNDGRILWTRWEYLDKGADFGHTLWSIRPDGTFPELVFGNDIIQPNGYVNGREVPGTREICCTLISHFGDLNGPIALIDIDKGRFNPKAINCITPEVPWPGAPPMEECFREAFPIARDYFLCSHAPRDLFGLYVIDRYGNRELIYLDPAISSMCPTPFQSRQRPPAIAGLVKPLEERGEFVLADVYRGLEPTVKRGDVKYIRVVEEVRHTLELQAGGEYPKDHEQFMEWYASPDDKVSGPFGWPSYVAKAPLGIVRVEEDGSAHFHAPAGRVLYFQALDKDFNEIQRMRSVIQLQPGEKRGCIGCHESRQMAPVNARRPLARVACDLEPPSWGASPFSFEQVVQPVLDARCTQCHDAQHKDGIDLTGTLDADKTPASYRTLITKGLVHYLDCGWNSGGCEKLPPLTFGSIKSKLWEVLNAGHHDVRLTTDEMLRIKTWIDLNCPLWPDYVERPKRPIPPDRVASNNTSAK